MQKQPNGHWMYVLAEFNEVTGVISITSNQTAAISLPQSVPGSLVLADGSYTLGLGGTAVGMLNVLNGVISIQEASP